MERQIKKKISLMNFAKLALDVREIKYSKLNTEDKLNCFRQS